jgi:flagellar protein FliO/FliZ
MLLLLAVDIATEPATPGGTMDFTWLFLKMLLVLGIVCVAAILFLKYVMPRTGLMRAIQKGQYFTVLGRYQLEPRKSLYVVEVSGRYLVIGASDHGISLVTELTEDQAKKREGGRGS